MDFGSGLILGLILISAVGEAWRGWRCHGRGCSSDRAGSRPLQKTRFDWQNCSVQSLERSSKYCAVHCELECFIALVALVRNE